MGDDIGKQISDAIREKIALGTAVEQLAFTYKTLRSKGITEEEALKIIGVIISSSGKE